MSTVTHHGPPGSYKTFTVIQNIIVPALLKGRTVVTNIRGVDSLDRIEESLGVHLPPEAEIIYVAPDDQKGFLAMSTFFHWVPKGALICIDEVQRVWSAKRDRDLKKFDLCLSAPDGEPMDDEYVLSKCPLWDGDRDRPENVENAFDQHRHYNWDIYITTPNIAKVHSEVRQVCEVAYRHKAMGNMLPWWKHKWREFSHDPENNGKSASHFQGTPKTFKAKQAYFGCYQSTKTGKAVGSSENRSIFRDPKLQVFGVIFCIVLYFMVSSAVDLLASDSVVVQGLSGSTEEIVKSVDSRSVDHSGDARLQHVNSVPVAREFNQLAPPAVADPVGSVVSSDPFGRFLAPAYDVRLLAALTTRNGKRLFYRIGVFQGGVKIDEFDQEQLRLLEYQERYSRAGLQVSKDGKTTLVRPLGLNQVASRKQGPSKADVLNGALESSPKTDFML